jgi:hypothetical protein
MDFPRVGPWIGWVWYLFCLAVSAGCILYDPLVYVVCVFWFQWSWLASYINSTLAMATPNNAC